MSDVVEPIRQFVAYALTLDGDEKGEAQVLCERLFQAFGHNGYKEAGATLEYRVKGPGKSTRFADLLWRPRLLTKDMHCGAGRRERQVLEGTSRRAPLFPA